MESGETYGTTFLAEVSTVLVCLQHFTMAFRLTTHVVILKWTLVKSHQLWCLQVSHGEVAKQQKNDCLFFLYLCGKLSMKVQGTFSRSFILYVHVHVADVLMNRSQSMYVIVDWWEKNHSRLRFTGKLLRLPLVYQPILQWMPGLVNIMWLTHPLLSPAGSIAIHVPPLPAHHQLTKIQQSIIIVVIAQLSGCKQHVA